MAQGIQFREISLEDAEKVLRWRTSARVTNFMNTDINSSLEDQKKWLQSCFSKPDYYHWIIEYQSKSIGLICLSDFLPDKQTTSWGFYIGEENFLGIGGFVPPLFYNFCFNSLNIKVIYAEVLYTNLNTIKLHLLHGYRFRPERDTIIFKNNKEYLSIGMSLQREDWQKKVRYKKNIVEFPITLWEFAPTFYNSSR